MTRPFWSSWECPQPLQVACLPQPGLVFRRDGSLCHPPWPECSCQHPDQHHPVQQHKGVLSPAILRLNLLCPLLISRFLCCHIYALSSQSGGTDKSTPALKIICFITQTCASAAATPWWVSIRAPLGRLRLLSAFGTHAGLQM